ncbi:TetR family transcriptional regulator [Streptomyces sp. AV19]|uniref:TetR family transcriptional regulator n=1 Tax=Streptomyces sp. AV19 TaxID=2793068 RepID=UPI0018FE043E|nr:TetR family transcriptional regulator [Streptomyces sp. AV19]MBH1934207.1 TetR family transcriptional regulator [Streptomyces sp. AV19]MDG4533873.1 TetR family transcriptional regulator [Streptomyces sp. AV19]
MAWDTARTRQALLDAAVDEFAEHGFDGARIERVGTRAGVNKERIYQYFGNKQQLYGHVLESELDRIATAIPLTAERAEDLGGYAGLLYDYHRARPQFIRLLHWEGLQDRGGPALKEAERTTTYGSRVAALGRARDAGALGPGLESDELFYAVLALAAWWFAVPQAVRMVFGRPADPDAERASLVRLARRLAGQERPPA